MLQGTFKGCPYRLEPAVVISLKGPLAKIRSVSLSRGICTVRKIANLKIKTFQPVFQKQGCVSKCYTLFIKK